MDQPVFDHERLDVYRISVEFLAWVGELIDEGPLKGVRMTAVKHLDDSARSILANIAEGNGKRSRTDRCRFFDISRGSALECAACSMCLSLASGSTPRAHRSARRCWFVSSRCCRS